MDDNAALASAQNGDLENFEIEKRESFGSDADERSSEANGEADQSRIITSLDNELDIDLIEKLYLKSSTNLHLEVKYPDVDRLLELKHARHKESSSNVVLEDDDISSYALNALLAKENMLKVDEYLKNYLKIVYVKVKPEQLPALIKTKRSLCETVLGIYPNLGFDARTNEYKVIVQGFVPKRMNYLNQQLKIGDQLVSINDVRVNLSNIENLLVASMKQSTTLKIVAVSPLTFVNLNTMELLTKRDENLERAVKARRIEKTVAVSKSTKVVKGDRVKCETAYEQEFNGFIMILSLSKEILKKNNNSSEKNDIIYKFPNSDCNQSMISSLNELLESIRGLLMTLALVVKNVNPLQKAKCCTIQYNDQLLNVCFLSQDTSSNELLLLIVPNDRIEMNYLKLVGQEMQNSFKFLFGAYSSLVGLKSSSEDNRLTKRQLDAFFGLFFKRLALVSQFPKFKNGTFTRDVQQQYLPSQTNQPPGTAAQPILLEPSQRPFYKILVKQRIIQLIYETRAKLTNQIPFYDLPISLKTEVDANLSDIEAQEYVDLENNYYRNRRQFSIVGTCLFFNDYLIATHLNHDTTKHVYDYCNHYGLFRLASNVVTSQYQVWKEVNIASNDDYGLLQDKLKPRHFLVVVGMREFILCMILEAGGRIARRMEKNDVVSPDPFFLQQANYLLNDMYENGVMTEIKQYFMRRDNAPVVDLTRFVMSRKKAAELIKARINSKSKSPVRVKMGDAGRGNRARSSSKPTTSSGKAANQRAGSRASPSPSLNRDPARQSRTSLNQSLSDNDLGQYGDLNDSDDQCENNSELYHFQKEQRQNHLNKAFMADWSSMPTNELKCFRDAKMQDSIIYYASSANNLNGVLYSLREYGVNTNLFGRVYYHFIQSCLKMQALFKSPLLNGPKSRESCGLNHMIEQGILFQIPVGLNPNQAYEHDATKSAKASADVKELCFWVVGRRKLHRASLKSDKWQNQGDFFICFHDNLDQALVELAFDVGFAKLGL